MYNIEYHNIDLKNNTESIDLAAKASTEISKKAIALAPLYKILASLDIEGQLSKIRKISETIRDNFSDLVIISMGGATLNPGSVLSLVAGNTSRQNAPKIHFLHNTDPYFFSELLARIELKNTVFLTISNSGTTLETLSLLGCILQECENNKVATDNNNFYFITDKSGGTLKEIAKQINGIIIPHEQDISGRYSGLTNVSTLAMMTAGLDAFEYLSGANQVIEDFHQNLEKSKPVEAALSIYNTNRQILVNIGYLQRFDTYLEWYSQIIAESLGKKNAGYTPLKGLGPNDQHSLLQLYLEGPRDKLFTTFYVKELGSKYRNFETCGMSSLGYIAGKKLHDINKANLDATATALIKQGLPVRKLVLDNLSERSVGALVAHSMIEIITLGHMMGINPFNQPGVELIKQESRILMDY
jgi:glucose-6-phosphate isomerase